MNPDTPGPFIRPYQALMSLIFSVTLLAGWSMLPGESERIAMLERDGHTRAALEILEAAYAGGERNYRTLHHMLALYEDQGNVAKAREVLQDMVDERPREEALRRRLANFYRGVGEQRAWIAALESQIEARYSEAACRDYIALLRLEGRGDEEIAAIQMCRQKGYRRAEDLVRLAGLVAVAGDFAQSTALLRSIDDVRRLKGSYERYQLVALLLDQGQPREAVRRAVRWIRAGDDDVFAVGLIEQFARSKHPEAAIDVAKDAGEAGDSISLTVAERLVEQSQPQVARLYLRGWLENAKLDSDDVLVRFVAAAVDVRDPGLALAGAQKFGIDKLPAMATQALSRAFISAAMRKEAAELMAVKRGVASRDTRTDGKTAAPVPPPKSSAERKSPSARRLRTVTLERADPLEVWRRSLWANLTNEAQRKAGSGPALPKAGRGFRGAGRGHSHTKVLEKTSRILQRTKKLKSLKIKQKLVREGARARAHTRGGR